MKPTFDYHSPEFDWFAVLEWLCANGNQITDGECWVLRRGADMWPTCACGQLCKSLPRAPDGRPLDDILLNLGLHFLSAIKDRDWKSALMELRWIEARAHTLLSREQPTQIS